MNIVVTFNRHPSHLVRSTIFVKRGYVLKSSNFFKSEKLLFRMLGYLELFIKIRILTNSINEIIFVKPSNVRLVKFYSKKASKVSFDIDDAIWSQNWLGEKLSQQLFSLADYVYVDNNYLSNYISEKYRVKNELVYGYIPDLSHKKQLKKDKKINIGWIGSPSTSYNLFAIGEILLELDKNTNYQLFFLGINSNGLGFIELSNSIFVPYYDEQIMIKHLTENFDIGIFPMFDIENNWGRGFHKLRLYLSANVKSVVTRTKYIDNEYVNDSNVKFEKNSDFLKAIEEFANKI